MFVHWEGQALALPENGISGYAVGWYHRLFFYAIEGFHFPHA